MKVTKQGRICICHIIILLEEKYGNFIYYLIMVLLEEMLREQGFIFIFTQEPSQQLFRLCLAYSRVKKGTVERLKAAYQ